MSFQDPSRRGSCAPSARLSRRWASSCSPSPSNGAGRRCAASAVARRRSSLASGDFGFTFPVQGRRVAGAAGLVSGGAAQRQGSDRRPVRRAPVGEQVGGGTGKPRGAAGDAPLRFTVSPLPSRLQEYSCFQLQQLLIDLRRSSQDSGGGMPRRRQHSMRPATVFRYSGKAPA